MLTRLAAPLLAAASLSTACVASHDDDLHLDALPSYDADTGGGKSDDPSCSDVSYRAFIQSYFASDATATADDNPCKWGNDASYRIWAYVAGEKLAPILTAYADAIGRRFSQHGTRDEIVAAGTLDAQAKSELARLEAVRPAHAGKVGAAAWREYLYVPTFAAATRIVGGDQAVLLTEGIDQRANEITPFEEEWLGFAERNQPVATEGHAYTLWWEVVRDRIDEVTGPGRPTTEPEASINRALIERLVATHPTGAFDEDATTFHTEVTAKIAADYGALTDPAVYEDRVRLEPSGGGASSYAVWATAFADVAQTYAGSSPNDNQNRLFQLVIDVRPCASGPEVDTIAERLRAGLADAGNGPDGASPLAQLAVPIACTTPE